MRVALVAPPIRGRYVQRIDEPLGLEYLAAVLHEDHDVCIVDSFNQHLTEADTIELLEVFEPDVVGISLVMAGARGPALEICRAAKGRWPHIRTVLGGQGGMAAADSLVGQPQVDCLVRGEGETTFRELLERCERSRGWSDVEGIVYGDASGLVRTTQRTHISDLNAHPFPARHLLPGIEEYRISILRSRGTGRRRDDDNVIAEMAHVKERYPRDAIAFADETFTDPPRLVIPLCRRIRAANLELKWSCAGRPETISPRLLTTMREAGCTEIFFSIESGSSKVLRRLGRPYEAEQVYDVYRLCVEMDIRPRFSFTFGLPGEDWDAVEDTWRLIERLEGAPIGVDLLTLMHGAHVGEHPENRGAQVTSAAEGDLDVNSDVVIDNGLLTGDQIREAYRRGTGIAARAGRRTVTPQRIREEAQRRQELERLARQGPNSSSDATGRRSAQR